ncbi:LysM peptidoglycan-binding domain-containing protein [Chengkuizengella axinellae]|uniref:LysM peptidoglycan-binding domain-containing protein n=1 Tax=Chengkuizengella axinellae TaxID=3064388 RepID=A0ABT9IZN8_9BACL|nr:LysM peptidoglycan-binding domain-containing protein [Chengkuizengella sp. 2205SS18-9]MDP5274678.1 LysM peptidoglycan-binding domain-containing protein [Chengkuizengella sp. 2205SS18-9]
MITHVVKSGESLYNISQMYGVPMHIIVEENNLESTDVIYVGQTLKIPTSEQTHYVKSGETLYGIAQTYGITVEELMRANNLTTTVIYVNQKLFIPAPTVSEEEGYHIVKSGESLWSIAQLYNIPIRVLMETNQLTTSNIYVGQKLKIPTGGTRHLVEKGDTLYSLSRRYGVTVQEIVDANDLSDVGVIYVGQWLYIPPVSDVSLFPTEPPVVNVYVVKSGDTLNSISRQFNVPLETLLKINNLEDPNQIYVGQMLIAPIVPETGDYHVVVPGDTISKIAGNYTVNGYELMRINGIKDANQLRVGQVLKLPPPVHV